MFAVSLCTHLASHAPAQARGWRSRLTKESPVAELLSEHCFAGKCSPSHLACSREVWEHCGWPASDRELRGALTQARATAPWRHAAIRLCWRKVGARIFPRTARAPRGASKLARPSRLGRSSPAGHIFGSQVTAAPKTDSPAELAKKCAAAA